MATGLHQTEGAERLLSGCEPLRSGSRPHSLSSARAVFSRRDSALRMHLRVRNEGPLRDTGREGNAH